MSRYRGAGRNRRSAGSRDTNVIWQSHYKVEAKSAAKSVGRTAADQVRRQAERGLDATGQPFPRYTERYARWKRREGGQVIRPDLKLTGRFLAAIRAYAARSIGRARAYVPIGVPRSKREQGRGLIGWGFMWLGLGPRGRRHVRREILRQQKLFVERRGRPSRD